MDTISSGSALRIPLSWSQIADMISLYALNYPEPVGYAYV